MSSLFLSSPYPAFLRPHPPSHPTSPLLSLSLPSHPVTSGTPSQPYWLTWPPCSCCHFQGIAYLTPGQPYWFTRCFGVISTPTLPLCFLFFLPPLVLILILVFVLDLFHTVATQFPSIPPFSSAPFPPIPAPHAFVDLLPRLVALKAVDPTFWTTIMITGPVKFIQLRSLGISKTETQQETLKSDKN